MENTAYQDKSAIGFLSNPIVSAELDQETKMKLHKKELRLDDSSLYVRKLITGLGGTQDLITASDDFKVGTRNIDKSRLYPLENFVIQAIMVGYGSHATDTDPAVITAYSNVLDDADQALSLATLKIFQDDKIIFEKPVCELMVQVESEKVKEEAAYKLKNLRLIKADRIFQIKLEFPEGQSVSSSNEHHVEVILFGSKTRKN